MYSHIIPLRIDDYVNRIAYPVEIVEYYFDKPKAYHEKDLVDIFPIDKNSLVYSRITVVNMIDCCYRKIKFKILHENDAIEIYLGTQSFLEELMKHSSIDEVAKYIVKVKTFYNLIEKSVEILARQGNTTAKEHLFNRDFANIFLTKDELVK